MAAMSTEPVKSIHLLFLCTGNSCRSQMAEGWARHLGGAGIEVTSAGIEAHGKNPRAIRAMREAGVDISQQQSKTLTPKMLEAADVVITVCGHADAACPVLPPQVQKEHWPLDDPARATGGEQEISRVFTASRDEIRRRVADLLARLARED
jgi:arsenate reductase